MNDPLLKNAYEYHPEWPVPFEHLIYHSDCLHADRLSVRLTKQGLYAEAAADQFRPRERCTF